MASSLPCLAVEKRSFLNALKSLRISARARQKDEVLLSYDDGTLSIKMQDSVVEVPADGSWPGVVRVYARFLIPIVTFPPDPDPLPLKFEDDRFFVAGWSVNATWRAGAAEAVALPHVHHSYLELAALGKRYSERELERSGLLKEVRDAEEVLQAQLEEAERILEPVGITADDLNDMVERKQEALGAESPVRVAQRGR